MKKIALAAMALFLLLLPAPIALAAIIAGAIGGAGAAPSAQAVIEIPPSLLPVYVAAASTCKGLPWEVLAAIGEIESHHGEGRLDPATGEVSPPVIGPALDGGPGFAAIRDPSFPDGWAHAVGPMQFLSTTWYTWALLAPGRPAGSSPDPENAWDAIYSAARYLCDGRPALDNLHDAVFRYNHSEAYYQAVTATALRYGVS